MSYITTLAEAIRHEVGGTSVPADADDLFLLYALLCLAKGVNVTEGDVHDAWSTWKTLRSEEHPSLIPFADLDEATRSEDLPFVLAIRRVAAGLRDGD